MMGTATVALTLPAQHLHLHSPQYVDFHLIVIRFRRGVLESHPAMARYTAVCDVNQVLDCLESLSPVCDILF